MFGFKERSIEELTAKNIDELVIDQLNALVEIVEAGDCDRVIPQIKACDELIRKLSPAKRSKVSLYWDGGCVSFVNMLANLPANMLATQLKALLPAIKTHTFNTLRELS